MGWVNGNYQRILFHSVRTASAARRRGAKARCRGISDRGRRDLDARRGRRDCHDARRRDVLDTDPRRALAAIPHRHGTMGHALPRVPGSRPARRVPIPAPVETPPPEVANARIKGPAPVIVPLVEPPGSHCPCYSGDASPTGAGRCNPSRPTPPRRTGTRRLALGPASSRPLPVRPSGGGQWPPSTLAVRIRFPRPYAPYRPLAEATAVRLPQLAFILRRCRAPPERRSPATPPGCRPFVKRTSLGAIGVGAYRSRRPLTRK